MANADVIVNVTTGSLLLKITCQFKSVVHFQIEALQYTTLFCFNTPLCTAQMISLSCYMFCLRHMMSLSLRGSLSKLPLAGAKEISVILPTLLNALPTTLSCTCRIDLLENPEAGLSVLTG